MPRYALFLALLTAFVLASAHPDAHQQRAGNPTPPATVAGMQALIVAEAAANGRVPPELALAVAREGSNFDPNALSTNGQRGVMQLTSSVARYEFGVSPVLLWDPQVNIELGVAYLDRLFERSGGDWTQALIEYFDGAAARSRRTDRASARRQPTRVRDVLRRWNDYRSDSSVARLVTEARQAAALPLPTRAKAEHRTLLDDMALARRSFRRALSERDVRGR